MTAIDNSPDMVARCRTLIEQDNSRVPVEVREGDIRDAEIEERLGGAGLFHAAVPAAGSAR